MDSEPDPREVCAALPECGPGPARLGVFTPRGAQKPPARARTPPLLKYRCSGVGVRVGGGLLRGEALKPATEPATKVSAICRRASRPVGLFPFLCCSWMRLSSSSLKAWRRRRGSLFDSSVRTFVGWTGPQRTSMVAGPDRTVENIEAMCENPHSTSAVYYIKCR